ncbi:hypothetical protein WM40_19810 [Robbsia andropogonis]|uniref:Uncharacterized protein n=1 Tax=Robbsia andropogonis TaxID=28092 RepID=A0A0F5JXN6_9BURK|nr:hypothetical protein WM40_19810 [Robbsia andropogonis]
MLVRHLDEAVVRPIRMDSLVKMKCSQHEPENNQLSRFDGPKRLQFVSRHGVIAALDPTIGPA